MAARTSSLAAGLGLALALIAAACAPTTRGPSTAAERDEPADAGAEPELEAEDEAEDVDGEVEAESERPIETEPAPCPTNMVLVAADELRFCIDKYEASLVEVDGEGNEKPFPHWRPVDGHTVRAVSEPDVFPQGFISEVQAEDACAASGKRLCSHQEWKTACMGPGKTTFPYGDTRQPGTCHDTGKSAVVAVFGARAYTDPGLSVRPKKPAQPATAKKAPAPGRSRTAKGATAKTASSKPARPAHTSTKGRAAEAKRPRATRSASKKSTAKAASTAKQNAPAKKNPPAKTRATAKRSEKSRGRETPASRAKRVPAKASARPASVEPSVWSQLNDPRLGQVEGALAKTGSHDACVNGFGALDMVGNLHEWVKTDASLPHGTFAGGYYLDTTLNGDGCNYRTTAHAHDYHDYSTGFRCCADAR